MSTAILVFTLLLCVASAALVVRVLRLPLPLTQIALGAAISVPSFGLHVDLQPKLFMLLFIPPLLFADGWRIPKREFFELRERILALAFGLVLFTVICVGYLLHWMIPAMPLAAALALAAVLSPTDAVAVGALAGRSGVPKLMMYVLQGEALMNDASGLTAFNFAIAAQITGVFSLSHASGAFVLVALGGILIGGAAGALMAAFQKWLAGWSQIEAQGTIMAVLLLPIASYLLAEELHVSGILAAVAAGMTMNLRSTSENLDRGVDLRIATAHIWSMIEYVLNGLIFVLLGLQLPQIFADALKDAYQDAGLASAVRLLVYAVATLAALLLTRLIWVTALVHAIQLYGRLTHRESVLLPRRLRLAAVLGGVRGAITLAGVLSVPLLLADGSAFPERGLMVFLAASVIVLSMVAAALGLPPLLRGLILQEDREDGEEKLARQRACEAAIAAVAHSVERASGSSPADASGSPLAAAASQIIEVYQQRLRDLQDIRPLTPDLKHAQMPVGELRLLAIRAERRALSRMHHLDEINDAVLNTLLYELDMREATLTLSKTRLGA